MLRKGGHLHFADGAERDSRRVPPGLSERGVQRPGASRFRGRPPRRSDAAVFGALHRGTSGEYREIALPRAHGRSAPTQPGREGVSRERHRPHICVARHRRGAPACRTASGVNACRLLHAPVRSPGSSESSAWQDRGATRSTGGRSKRMPAHGSSLPTTNTFDRHTERRLRNRIQCLPSQASARARRNALSRALRVSVAAAVNSERASASRPARNRKSPLAAGNGA